MRRTFRLRSRLALGAVGIALVLAVPLAVVFVALKKVHTSTLELRDGEFPASLLLSRMREQVDLFQRNEDRLAIVRDSASRINVAANLDTMANLADSLNAYDLQTASMVVHLALDSLRVQTEAEYQAAVADDSKRVEEITKTQIRPRVELIKTTIAESELQLRARTQTRVDAASAATSAAERLALITVIIAVVLTILIAVWLIRSVSRPVLDLEMGMKKVASGDFSHRLSIPPDRGDEFGKLSASFASMSNQLADLDRLKAEFISIASHELKTPINVIMGYIELLQEGIYGRLNEAQREVSSTIGAQAHSLTRLVRRLLDVSRFEAGGGKIECRTMNLPTFLDGLESSFKVLAMQRGVEFSVERGEGLPTDVRWDEDRMNEVVGNLLSNAFKFTPRGGHVHLAAMEDDGHIRITVHDTGAGIPAEQLPRVFTKFFQADNQSKAATKGTGLGLAIAKHIVEAHQGTISAESQVGQGTTFTIVMPAKVDLRRTGQFVVAVEAEEALV